MRISWLSTARNRLFEASARSARSRARRIARADSGLIALNRDRSVEAKIAADALPAIRSQPNGRLTASVISTNAPAAIALRLSSSTLQIPTVYERYSGSALKRARQS